jgi:hypothetical protein
MCINKIGFPQNINAQYGLMDGTGRALQDVYSSYNQPTDQAWMSFDQVYELIQTTTGQMAGSNWYHWVALRGASGPNLWIANSAPGYMGIYNTLSREDFQRLGGFSVVWLT